MKAKDPLARDMHVAKNVTYFPRGHGIHICTHFMSPVNKPGSTTGQRRQRHTSPEPHTSILLPLRAGQGTVLRETLPQFLLHLAMVTIRALWLHIPVLTYAFFFLCYQVHGLQAPALPN